MPINSMLTENEVVAFVKEYLEAKGYTIDRALQTTEKSIDIEVTHLQEGKCFVEAKGETSSKEGTSRFENHLIKVK